ncbi:MAG: hypothetical protein JXJ04_03550 [Spirochaetales bacterium]|nr:hypothetical protein [Spirochaetales bacterium]
MGDTLGTFLSHIKTLCIYKPVDMIYYSDGIKRKAQRIYNISIGRTYYIASGIKVHNTLKQGDGLFYNLIIKNLSLISLIPCLKAIYSGDKVKNNRTISLSYTSAFELESGGRRIEVEFNGQSMLFSMDEFSKEDNFRESDPGVLGANLATGSISDILASGGIPLFYAHAMVIGDTWDDQFIKEFSQGIAEVLAKAKTTFLGGDLGKSKTWHYTASVIGKAPLKPVRRTGARAGENIYITGRIGGGNLEAALTLYVKKYSGNKMMSNIMTSIPIKFVLRLKESRLIQKYASCSIDTSDGVFNALNEIAEKNKGTGLNHDI